ncbi:hypothetical protein SAMN05421819_1917 [Bryocella elongata]|uniref:Uncharacterized protein n=1 Tax=Bryocella elongata TaxID=863522 RepID=A0A1H5XPS4_9BACT|nr:hypothetical protein [Bryocella elongata]SEG13759.1 hypothetical protein SAMN05421819_1917 [Bryocella elongata]
MPYTGQLEYSDHRKMRTRNTTIYRALHWPIWIWVFFLAPGPLTFSLFAHGFSKANATWLALVLIGTGIAAYRGALPGAEPAPYILRFDEDKPNPLYRRVCYTFAWSAVITFASLNFAGLAVAAITGHWYLKQIYNYAYAPLSLTILALGALGRLPRVKKSTKGEGTERRYFYGSVWSVTLAQTVLMIFWKTLPNTREASAIKLAIYTIALALLGLAAANGRLPRTRPIVPGELMVD